MGKRLNNLISFNWHIIGFIGVFVAISICISTYAIKTFHVLNQTQKGISEIKITPSKRHNVKKVSYAQDLWISALEYCESRGKGKNAVNLNDPTGIDYYWFQFQAPTFWKYAQKYEIVGKDIEFDYSLALYLMLDYNITRQIVENMVLDKSVNFAKKFPLCVKKIGLPPNY